MKYGTIAKNPSVNAEIYRCFGYIDEKDAKAFVTKFREQPHDQNQVMHTRRELVLGGFLASNGFNVRYDQAVLGKTPDWALYDQSAALSCIIELVNFHTDRATEDEIEQHLCANRTWCDFMPSHVMRLYDRIRAKASTYKGLVKQAQAAYVVALFGDFSADVELQEVQ